MTAFLKPFADQLFAWFGIAHPATYKYVWLGLLIASVALRLLAAWRIELWGFRLYMLTSVLATVFQNRDSWGEWGEVWLAFGLCAFAGELLFFSVFGERHAAARGYYRQFSLWFGLLVLGVTLYVSPVPYPLAYPAAWYFTRLYSTITAFAVVFCAAIYSWNMRVHVPAFLRAYGLIAAAWLGSIFWSGTQHSREPWPWFRTAIVSTSIQIACLLAWVIARWIIGDADEARRSPVVSPQIPYPSNADPQPVVYLSPQIYGRSSAARRSSTL